jgi:hypothetical protein
MPDGVASRSEVGEGRNAPPSSAALDLRPAGPRVCPLRSGRQDAPLTIPRASTLPSVKKVLRLVDNPDDSREANLEMLRSGNRIAARRGRFVSNIGRRA